MRWPILVNQKVVTQDSYGGEVITWNTIYSLKAAKKTESGNKNVTDEEVFTDSKITFIIHYRDVQTDNVIVYNNKNYRITNLTEIGFRQGLQIAVDLIVE